MTANIKYQPLSNYHWNTLLEGTGKLKNYLCSFAPFSVYLPPKIAMQLQLGLSIVDLSSGLNARSVVQYGVALGNQIDPKIGLLIHTVHSLVMTNNFATATIDLLTLASFITITKRQALLVSLAQAMIQSMQCFYEAYEEKEDRLKLFSCAVLGLLHFNRAIGYYQDIQDLAGKIFILMRHANR